MRGVRLVRRGAAGPAGPAAQRGLRTEPAITSPELRERLTAYTARRTGDPGVAVEDMRRLAGGASREIWAFDLVRAGTRERLVLRRDPPGHHVQSSRRDEFALLRAAQAVGLPVPRVLWCEADAAALGSPFFIMEFVEGETLARRLLRDAEYASARAALPGQLAAALARIHTIDPADPTLVFLPRPSAGESPVAVELARQEQVYRAITPDPHPALELALRWLAARLPSPAPPTVVHGDYRIGNVIFGPEGLRAVLDWELAHVGDPREDLGWFCVRSWRFGADDRQAGGLTDRETFFAAYERAAGKSVDRAALRWWEVFGNLKWAVICILQARTYLDGAVKSVELASLGRRVAEMELELLELTEA